MTPLEAWCGEQKPKNAAALRLVAIVGLSDKCQASQPIDKRIAAYRELQHAIHTARDDLEALAEELLNLPKG